MSRIFPCPLCENATIDLFFEQKTGVNWNLYPSAPVLETLRFFRCGICDLVFKDPSVRLSERESREFYSHHRNEIADSGYREFLSKLARPLVDVLKPGARGLDFGCGPVAAMADVLGEIGFACESWDPAFHSISELLTHEYEFLVCSEVAEHFHEPGPEFRRLFGLLKPGGWLAVMTTFRPEERFDSWWYHKDPTHVVFYTERTFRWIAEANRASEVRFPAKNIALLRKP